MSTPDPAPAAPAANAIDDYLRQVVGNRGSDLHLIAGEPPRMRLFGDLQALRPDALSAASVEEILLPIMSATARTDFTKRDSTDFAYAVPGSARFRVNVFRHLGGMGAVFRTIPSQTKTLKQLELPSVLANLARQPQGMLLVTGKTGSGKSTTLAAIIDEINNRIPGVHADADQFASTLEICAVFGQRMVRGGAILFDDYSALAGCRRAVDLCLPWRTILPDGRALVRF